MIIGSLESLDGGIVREFLFKYSIEIYYCYYLNFKCSEGILRGFRF